MPESFWEPEKAGGLARRGKSFDPDVAHAPMTRALSPLSRKKTLHSLVDRKIDCAWRMPESRAALIRA